MKMKTSITDPLQIATVVLSTGGRIGMTFCPGKYQPNSMYGYPWDRDLEIDLQAIKDWDASTLVTLMESHELEEYKVSDIGEVAQSMGLEWFHLPIKDVSIPNSDFEQIWKETAGPALRQKLKNGEGIVIHCLGGLGRTGLIAARLLLELGEFEPLKVVQEIRDKRPGAIQTPRQENYVKNKEWEH